MSNGRSSPDDRELTDDPVPVAKRGKPKPSTNLRAAETWLTEATKNHTRCIDYYARAVEYYDREGHTETAERYRRLVNTLRELL